MSDCDIWEGSKTQAGYGMIGLGSVKNGSRGTVYVHRLVWMQDHGHIDGSVDVMHSCDTPSCINIEHLSAGTRDDNLKDMARKGRHWSKTRPDEFKAHWESLRRNGDGRFGSNKP